MIDGGNSERPQTVAPQVFCRSCTSPLVQASDWERKEGSRWSVRLWCPDCGFEQMAVLDRVQVTYLTLAIEEGFACALEALGEFGALCASDLVLDEEIEFDGPGSDLVRRARSERIEPVGD